MRYVISFVFMILTVGLAQAQDTTPQDDRGYLQSLIEDNLSTEDTQVRIEGFNGSLFAASSIDQLTISDADGIWLTMTGMKLDWSRAALLSRRLEVTELSVQDIVLDRLPPGKSAPPSAEAKPFKLPELPTSRPTGLTVRPAPSGSLPAIRTRRRFWIWTSCWTKPRTASPRIFLSWKASLPFGWPSPDRRRCRNSRRRSICRQTASGASADRLHWPAFPTIQPMKPRTNGLRPENSARPCPATSHRCSRPRSRRFSATASPCP